MGNRVRFILTKIPMLQVGPFSWPSSCGGAVVDEDVRGGGLDVEVVVAGDGEVPHPAVVHLGGTALNFREVGPISGDLTA